MSDRSIDPLIANELIRIGLETYQVVLELSRFVVQIGGNFQVKLGQEVLETFTPSKKIGNVSVLWNSIGANITDVIWTDSIKDAIILTFENGIVVEILPSTTGPRGSILGGDDTAIIADDF